MRLMRLIVCAVIMTAITASPGTGLAKKKPVVQDGQGMYNHMFTPAVDTKGFLTVDASPVLPHLKFSLSLMLDFGFNNWFAVEAQNQEIYDRTFVKNYINSALSLNLGLFNHMVIGAQVPITVPSGKAYNFNDSGELITDGWANRGDVGDLAFHIKANILRADVNKVGIGAVVQYFIPLGEPQWLAGDPKPGTLAAKLIFDVQPISWYHAGLNVGIRAPLGAEEDNNLLETLAPADFERENPDDPTSTDLAKANLALSGDDRLLFKYGPALTFGLGQSLSFWPEVMDFVIEIYGEQAFNGFGDPAYLSMEAGGAIKLFVEKNSYLMAGYSHGIPVADTGSGYSFRNFEHRMFIGFAFEPSVGDRDGDGITDYLDQCPDDPEDLDNFEDSDGCPDPDNDKDGIPDVRDECPNTPEDKDGNQDFDGCPEEEDTPSNDRDKDGILDDLDKCPDEPEDKDKFEDEDGCPDLDNDKDGILDKDDLCMNDPEDKDGYEDKDGCPEPDNDRDRILDEADQCPDEAEVYNGTDDEDGCPDEGDVVMTQTSLMILKKIYFKYNSAKIKDVSYPILDAVVATIINNPQIGNIEIQGHADERGNDKYNLKLTQKRADAVKKYLIKNGVPSEKLNSVGYGEYCPVNKEANEKAWEENRRVDFKILSVNGVATGAEVSCEKAREKGIGVKK